MRIDSSGRLLVGQTSTTDVAGVNSALQIVGTGAASFASLIRYADSSVAGVAPGLLLTRSNGAKGTNTIVASGNSLGFLHFVGANGSSFNIASTISGEIDGTPGASNDMPGRLVFLTTPDGSATALERMRIDSGGSVRIGGTASFSLNENLALYGTSTANNPTIISTKAASGSVSSNHVLFENSNGYVGSITTNASATAYNTSSDYRLKENVTYNFDATTRLKELKPARFNFITDATKTVDGFLAHEVQSVIPEAITGIKDETLTKEKVVVNSNDRVIAENIEQADWEAGKIPNKEGKSQYPIDSTWEASKVVPVYQGIDQAKLTPILTKALQEAIAKIEQLEARLTALES